MYLNPFMLEFALTAIAMLVELWSEENEHEDKGVPESHRLSQVCSTKYGTMELKVKDGHDQLSTPEKMLQELLYWDLLYLAASSLWSSSCTIWTCVQIHLLCFHDWYMCHWPHCLKWQQS